MPHQPDVRLTCLEKAAEVFAERGFSASTFSDMAARMDTNQAAWLRQFASKSALAKQVTEQVYRGLPGVDSVGAGFDHVGLQRLSTATHSLGESLASSLALRGAMRLMSERSQIDATLPDASSAWREFIESRLLEAKAAREIPDSVVVADGATAVLAAIHGVTMLFINEPSRISGQMDDVVGTVIRGLTSNDDGMS